MNYQKLSYVLLSLMLVFALLGVVSAQTAGETFFKDIITQWESGTLSDVIVRVFFAVIVLLLVMTFVGRLPGLGDPDKAWLRWVMGIVITLLATAYLNINELKATFFGYSALGFVLAVAVPFLLLVFFTLDLLNPKKLGIKQAGIAKLLVYVLWIGFAGFILYRIIKLSGGSVSVSEPLKYAHWVLLALALFVVLFMRTISRKLISSHYEGLRQGLTTVFEEARLSDEAEATEIESTLTAANKKFKSRK